MNKRLESAERYKDFEDFLNAKFAVDEPTTLDDDWPDAFNDWLEKQDPSDFIKWADQFVSLSHASNKRLIESLVAELKTHVPIKFSPALLMAMEAGF